MNQWRWLKPSLPTISLAQGRLMVQPAPLPGAPVRHSTMSSHPAWSVPPGWVKAPSEPAMRHSMCALGFWETSCFHVAVGCAALLAATFPAASVTRNLATVPFFSDADRLRLPDD